MHVRTMSNGVVRVLERRYLLSRFIVRKEGSTCLEDANNNKGLLKSFLLGDGAKQTEVAVDRMTLTLRGQLLDKFLQCMATYDPEGDQPLATLDLMCDAYLEHT